MASRTRAGVGKSDRTPAKHALMTALYGREVGAAHRIPQITDLLWLDLTAGDGLPAEEGREWIRSCSPGILAYLARFPRGNKGPAQASKRTTVLLYERAANTYKLLLKNLAENLSDWGYQQTDEDEWHCGPVTLRAVNASGAEADLSLIHPATAVMVSNDPNAITDWAMSPMMPAAISARTPWFLGLSTMGCNASGVKRDLSLEQRQGWYGHVESQGQAIQAHHDLYLAKIERDAHQWAYLITSPGRWREATEECADASFRKHGMTLETAWLRTDFQRFQGLADVLFKTKKELGE